MLQEQVRALLQKHCATINEVIQAMDGLFAQLPDPSADRAALIGRLKELAHQIKSSSGSIGFTSVSAAADKLDGALKSFMSAGSRLDEAAWQLAVALFQALQRTAERITPEQSTLYKVDPSRLSHQSPEAGHAVRLSGDNR